MTMKWSAKRLTLHESATYEICVSGHIAGDWSAWGADIQVICVDNAGVPISAITGELDQAALHGVLRRLYSLGCPLMSVRIVEQTGGEEAGERTEGVR
jgi:hypothetical protein